MNQASDLPVHMDQASDSPVHMDQASDFPVQAAAEKTNGAAFRQPHIPHFKHDCINTVG